MGLCRGKGALNPYFLNHSEVAIEVGNVGIWTSKGNDNIAKSVYAIGADL